MHTNTTYSIQMALPDQARLVASLARRLSSQTATGKVELIETHISWVLLTEDLAYKIKKAIRLDFLDFTDLERRRFYCEEEIRLNRRLAPQIYLDIVPIGGTPDIPDLGRKPALEWAVRMIRFDMDDQMDRRLKRGTLLARHIDSLAVLLARFHQGMTPQFSDAADDDARIVCEADMQNLAQLRLLLTEADDHAAFEALERATEDECRARLPAIARRRDEGSVRECHGDLHLANIVLIVDEVVPFDCLEFDPALRWIDVISELAFPYMDLIRYGRPDLAHRLLSRYLEETGDYGGVELLPLYASGRAAVRAKVYAILAGQILEGIDGREGALAACRAYLEVAERLLAPRHRALIITCGLPGSGKSTYALAAAERLGSIRIRSDVERKRLFGLSPLDASLERAGDIYGPEASARTYQALHDIAGRLLSFGFSVIVDAAFLKQSERDSFRWLANSLGVPFAIAEVRASDAMLRRRIAQRLQQGGDPSEADLAVLTFLRAVHEPLLPVEQGWTVEFVNDGENGFVADDGAWKKLEKLIGITAA